MDNSRPHLSIDDSAIIDGKTVEKKGGEILVGNGAVYHFVGDADEEWGSDVGEGGLDADYYPTTSKSEVDVREGMTMGHRGRAKLRDARLDEPRTTEFTMTKFDRLARRTEDLRGKWEKDARGKSSLLLESVDGGKKMDKGKGKGKGKAEFGTPIHDYTTYHASTVALLRPDAESLDSLFNTHKLKRQNFGKSISEKSSLVNLKAGNTLERMVTDMITPGPEEIGEQAFREVEADRAIETDEESGWDRDIEKSRGRVDGWGGRNWGRRESL